LDSRNARGQQNQQRDAPIHGSHPLCKVESTLPEFGVPATSLGVAQQLTANPLQKSFFSSLAAIGGAGAV
jgi:hypothetical protein